MRLLKPSWVTHDGHPIFSVDIHPDGSRFATGGQGVDTGRICIWNMAPVMNEEDEKDENVPKMLCQLDNHLACVNCVRWSGSGICLASGGDDKTVMIWQIGRYGTGSSVFGSGGKMVNVEQWRCVSHLRGHSGDILDLAWSPHDAWLSTCSVDNTIVIWNAHKWQEIIAVLKGHTGLVKGVSWDPVGKYIASQADDKSLRVWRTHDWQQEAVITEPFAECGGTTHILRLSWSPDGQYLVSAHAMNNSGPTAQIVERDGWKTNKDFVGHRKAITCVRFNPNILSKISKENEKVHHFCCCAIGSRDRSLSVWLTCLKRPLVVIHDLFSNSVLDISWSQSGSQLLVCSWDGTVAYIDFGEEEIGKPVSVEEKSFLHQRLYGKSLAMTNHNTSTTTVIENPELLKLQEEQKKELLKKEVLLNNKTSVVKENGVAKPSDQQNAKCLQIKGPLDKQIETRMPDGRRRITPLFIPPANNVDDIPLPFNSRGLPTFSSSSESKSRIVIEKRDESVGPVSSPLKVNTSSSLPAPSPTIAVVTTVAAANKASSQPPLVTSVAAAPDTNKEKQQSTVQVNSTAAIPDVPTTAITTASDVIEKQKEQPMVKPFTIPLSQVNIPAATAHTVITTHPVTPIHSVTQSHPTTPVHSVSSHPSTVVHIPVKRKAESSSAGPGRPPGEKKKPGRPPLSQSQQVSPERDKAAAKTAPATITNNLHLPVLKVEKSLTVQVSSGGKGDQLTTLELENDLLIGSAGAIAHKLTYAHGGTTVWQVLLSARGSGISGSQHLACAVCEDSTLSIFSSTGRRIYAPIVLTSPPTRLVCSHYYVMVITSRGCVSVWDVQHQKMLVKDESLMPIMQGGTSDVTIRSTGLTEGGAPTVSLSTSKSYIFNPEMSSWMLVSDPSDIMYQCSDHHTLTPSPGLSNGTMLPLASLQRHLQRSTKVATTMFRGNPNMQKLGTLSHLDSQLTSAYLLHSGKEYHFWLLTLVRYLAQEGLELRLRDTCDALLGPVTHTNKSSSWDPFILGMKKRDLLQEILPIIGSNLRLQRLFTEYKDQLDSISS